VTITLVTGTGTGVGKTVAVAALAALAVEAGDRVTVIKPVQTGLASGEPGDLADVTRLTGLVDVYEFVRFADPLSPEAAARREQVAGPSVRELQTRIQHVAADYDTVFVEGAGGLLVRLNDAGETFADLAVALASRNLLVVAAGLGSLNHTALTLEVARNRGIAIDGVIVGAWPEVPDLACQENLSDLTDLVGGPLLGMLPAGLGQAGQAQFLATVRTSLAPGVGGRGPQPGRVGSYEKRQENS
jgi:dethiobiotin synthetase